MVCYAVRSDLMPSLLSHKWNTPSDWLIMPNSYGAINIEDILGLSSELFHGFRNYWNPFIKRNEYFIGVVACSNAKSQTFQIPKLDIITLCTGYPYHVYERFTGSLYDTGFTGRVYFIITESDVPKIQELRKQWPNVQMIIDTEERTTHLQSHRYKVIAKHIDTIDLFDYILICDSRDVLFQRNPEDFFPFPFLTDMYVFEEDLAIQDEPYNKKWITDLGTLVQRDLLHELGLKPILCSGTTICSKQSVKTYVEAMCSVLSDSRIPKTYIMDQGAHNYLVYCGFFNTYNIQYLSNNDNFVNTIGVGYKKVNDDKLIVNHKNEVSYIVHQYDRLNTEEKKRLSSKYNFVD